MTTIKRTSHTDPASIEATAKLMAAITLHDAPKLPTMTPRMCELWHEIGWPGRVTEHYLSYQDGVAVGRVEVSFHTIDNLQNAYFTIEVLPEARRHGVGRELFSFMLERVRAEGRNTIMTDTAWAMPGMPAHDDGAGPAFAESVEMKNANLTAVIRRLDLSTVDEAVLDDLDAKALAKSDGYRIVQWHDQAPEEYVDDVAYLDSRLIEDAPMGDLALEPEKVDAARTRAIEAAQVARGRLSFNTAAVHVASNRLVAWTGMNSDSETPWHAWQGITIVDPDHRGHRLGALVKVANLRLLREQLPQVTTIDTGNASVNSYMISINEQMGFRPLYAWQNWQRDL